MNEEFKLDYWTMAAALRRGLHELGKSGIDEDSARGCLVIELDRAYPQFDWHNVLTDSWPLREPGPDASAM